MKLVINIKCWLLFADSIRYRYLFIYYLFYLLKKVSLLSTNENLLCRLNIIPLVRDESGISFSFHVTQISSALCCSLTAAYSSRFICL